MIFGTYRDVPSGSAPAAASAQKSVSWVRETASSTTPGPQL